MAAKAISNPAAAQAEVSRLVSQARVAFARLPASAPNKGSTRRGRRHQHSAGKSQQLPGRARAVTWSRPGDLFGVIMTGYTHSDEMIASVCRLRREGLSSAQIAMRLGLASRNVVIGITNRHGHKHGLDIVRRNDGTQWHNARRYAKRRAKPAQAKPAVVRAPKPQRLPSLPISPLPPPVVSDLARVSLADAEHHHCRFIPGDARGVPAHAPLFCGETVVPGTSWCPGHLARVTEAPQPARKRQEFALPDRIKGRKLEHA